MPGPSASPRNAGGEEVPVPFAARFALDGAADGDHLLLREVHDAVDSGGDVGGTLDEDPGANALEDLLGVVLRPIVSRIAHG